MNQLLGFCKEAEDAELLRNAGRNVAAAMDLPEWQTKLLLSLRAFMECLVGNEEADIFCVDVTPEGAIGAAEDIRRKHEMSQLLILAGMDISPMLYLRPSIRASSLLLKPFTVEQAEKVMRELIQEIHRNNKNEAGTYVIETKQEKILISYNDIKFFEAKERKIFLCTKARRIPFYSTLEQLGEELPKQFIRCHKGFIINSEQIERIDFTQNTIHLRDGFQIPVSRSYKSTIRELNL